MQKARAPKKMRREFALPAGQVMQAGVNFLFLLGAARGLEPARFAAVSVAWIWFTVLITAQRTMLGEQVIVDSRRGSGVHARAILIPSGLLVALGFLITTGAVAVSGYTSDFIFLVALSGASMLANDAVRYACMAKMETGRLLRADGLSLFGMLGGVGVAEATDNVAFVLAAPFAVSTLTFALMGGLVMPRISTLDQYIRSLGSFFHWAGAQVLITNLASQAVVLLTIPALGARDFAGLRAMQAVLGPISTPATAMQPLLFNRLARRQSTRSQLRPFVVWAAGMSLVFAVIGLLLASTAPWWIPVLVGEAYTEYSSIVLPSSLTLGMVYVGLPVATWLRTLRLGREIVFAQGIAVAVAVFLVPAAAWGLGVVGAAWALTMQAVTSVLAAYVLLWRHLD